MNLESLDQQIHRTSQNQANDYNAWSLKRVFTCFVVEGVVVGHAVGQELQTSASYIPVDIGVPLITVPAQVRLLEVTLFITEKHRKTGVASELKFGDKVEDR